MRKSILAPSQSNVSGSVLRLKAVEMRARPPVCLPCAFSNWAVYYTCARCSFGWNLKSLGRRGLRAVCASWSPAAASKLWGRAAKVSSAGGSPGLGDVTCRGHDWRIDCRPVSSVRGHVDFRAVVRTSEPLAHKPLGAGSSVLNSKDFRPQLEQRHVLIRTDNMSVVSYINNQGGVRSNKHAANLLLCADRHFLSIRAAHISSLLNHRADMLSRKGIPQGEWRLHPESVRMIWTRYGAAEVDLFATSSRMHIACCSSPCLTPRWRGTRWQSTGQQPGCVCVRVCIYIYIYKKKKKRGASVILIAPNWPNQLWFPDQTELLVASPWPIPVRKDLLSQMSGSGWHPNPELWSLHVWLLWGYQRSWVPCILVCSTCSRRRGHPLRGICMLWNGECLWNSAVMFISTRLLAPCRMFCVFYGTDWLVDLYYQHWKSTWPLLPRFVPRWAGNRLVGTRWWWVFL